MQRGEITILSEGNVLETLSSSHGHQINVDAPGNLIRLRGVDAVQVRAAGNMILSVYPTFEQ